MLAETIKATDKSGTSTNVVKRRGSDCSMSTTSKKAQAGWRPKPERGQYISNASRLEAVLSASRSREQGYPTFG